MARPIPIEHRDDPRIEAYRAVRERDLAGRDGRFVVEGEVPLRLMARHGRFALESLLIADKRLAALADLVERLDQNLPVYAASPEVMDAIVGFPIHRGVLGVGLRGTQPAVADLLGSLPGDALVVVPVGIANHDNIGGIFRNAAAFGADAVLLDGASCDPLYRKAIRVSVGASLTVPFARGGEPLALLDALEARDFVPLALSPAGSENLVDIRRPRRAALLLGAEGPGLPDAVVARARAVRIPMAPGFDSLNVATASGIALYALAASGSARNDRNFGGR